MALLSVVVWIFVIILVFLLVVYNGLIALRNSVKNSWAGIDVQLKRRADLIPNLVKSVKGYMKHEKNIIEEVTQARLALLSSKGEIRKSAAAEGALEDSLKTLFALAENYPKLKANENFLKLQEELSRTESEIAAARRIYNDNVRLFNTKIETVPNNLVAKLFNFVRMDYFKATKKEKENVVVSL